MKSYAFDQPTALPVEPDGIPVSLKQRRQFVCWRYARKGERWIQIPVMPFGQGWPARVDKPRTWSSFDTALDFHQNGNADGIGFVLTAPNGIVGVTLKRAFDPDFDTLEPWAAELLGLLNTYCELSPDGRDVKAFIGGRIPRAAMLNAPDQPGRVGLYSDRQFFTVTGSRLAEYPPEVRRNQKALNTLIERYFAPSKR